MSTRTWWSTSTITSSRAQRDGSFAFGLDLILDGLERIGSTRPEPKLGGAGLRR